MLRRHNETDVDGQSPENKQCAWHHSNTDWLVITITIDKMKLFLFCKGDYHFSTLTYQRVKEQKDHLEIMWAQMALRCAKLNCKRTQGCLFKDQIYFLPSERSTHGIFFNTQICFLASEDDNMNSTCYILQCVNDEDESGSWMHGVEEMLKFLMRNQGCSCLLLYITRIQPWPKSSMQKKKKKKTGDFFFCFQISVHHHGMSEKKARGRKWIPHPGRVPPTLLLPRLTLATLLIHPRHTSVQGRQGHCVPLQCSPASTGQQWNAPQPRPTGQSNWVSFFLESIIRQRHHQKSVSLMHMDKSYSKIINKLTHIQNPEAYKKNQSNLPSSGTNPNTCKHL